MPVCGYACVFVSVSLLVFCVSFADLGASVSCEFLKMFHFSNQFTNHSKRPVFYGNTVRLFGHNLKGPSMKSVQQISGFSNHLPQMSGLNNRISLKITT